MLTRKAFKFRIYPTEEQKESLAIQFGHCRFVYNYCLNLRKQIFFETGETFSYYDCKKHVTAMKKAEGYEWLKDADSQALQCSIKDLDTAFQNFFRMSKEGTLPPPGKKPRKDGMPKGYPKFKSRYSDQSYQYPQRFKVEGSKTYLPKVGWVRTIFHRPIEGKMKNCTVTKTTSGQYYISIQCEIEIDVPERLPNEVGIDLGLKDFAILSTGQKIESQQHYRKAEKRLKRLQKRLSKKKLGSNNRTKAKTKLAKAHEKVTNQRRDFHHKESRKLVNQFGFIGFENLHIKGMLKNHHLAKSISDAGWSQFVWMCEYKQKWNGGEVGYVDRFFPSSKLCSHCGSINHNLKLKHRSWTCDHCGITHDRDKNAAINILKQSTVGATESNACQIRPAVTQSGQEQVQQIAFDFVEAQSL
jgi:putative transposase